MLIPSTCQTILTAPSKFQGFLVPFFFGSRQKLTIEDFFFFFNKYMSFACIGALKTQELVDSLRGCSTRKDRLVAICKRVGQSYSDSAAYSQARWDTNSSLPIGIRTSSQINNRNLLH